MRKWNGPHSRYCSETTFVAFIVLSLQWRHNGHDVSNHQPHHCLLNRLLGRRSKKTSKLRVTGLCVGKMIPFDDVIMYIFRNQYISIFDSYSSWVAHLLSSFSLFPPSTHHANQRQVSLWCLLGHCVMWPNYLSNKADQGLSHEVLWSSLHLSYVFNGISWSQS